MTSINIDFRDDSCPHCHYHSDQFRDTGKCLCGYNLNVKKVVHAAPDVFKKIDENEDIYSMLRRTMEKTHLRKVRTQIKLMAGIYYFFTENPDYDYTVADIMKGLNMHSHSSSYSVEMALFRLQQCGFVKYCRDISGKTSWQLTSWHQEKEEKEKENENKVQ